MQITAPTETELLTGQESKRIYPAFQWKYRIDASEPWWRRWYFHLVWLPFARFSCLKVGMVPFERLEPDGSLSWKEEQGYFTEEWRAAQEAAKYPYGGYRSVALNACESPLTCHSRSLFPNSKAQKHYRRRNQIAVDVAPVERLQQAIVDTQQLVDSYRQRKLSRPS